MAQWYCFKCKEKMQEDNIEIMYMDMLGFQPGLVCPKCGVNYLKEETVGAVRKSEKEIEAKFA